MSDSAPTPQERAARRRRLAEVFGDSLPEQTRDDARDPREEGDPSAAARREDERLLREVPPHHGT